VLRPRIQPTAGPDPLAENDAALEILGRTLCQPLHDPVTYRPPTCRYHPITVFDLRNYQFYPSPLFFHLYH